MELEIKGKIMIAEPLSNHTSLHIGGKAKYFLFAANSGDIAKAKNFVEKENIPIVIIGKGSNILFSDEGFSGMVISTEDMNKIEIQGTRIIAQAGASLSQVIKIAKRASLSGIEELIGIPGSVGGASVMNASAFECEIGKYIKAVKVLKDGGECLIKDMQFGYRKSSLSDEFVVEIEFEFTRKEKEYIENKISEIMEYRRKKHPFITGEIGTCGSVFKNPQDSSSAGELIERAGCKGLNIGGVKVSEKHCNFFLTKPGSSAKDFIGLVDTVRNRVKEKFDVSLELEVKVIGKEKEIQI
jgi:UDP-N-acetylmuramate dehydrogenase